MARDNLAKRNWFHSLVPSAISGTFNLEAEEAHHAD
jgi:hypothetical protein